MQVEDFLKVQSSMVEMLAQAFIEYTGLTPDQAILVQQKLEDDKVIFYFEKKDTVVAPRVVGTRETIIFGMTLVLHKLDNDKVIVEENSMGQLINWLEKNPNKDNVELLLEHVGAIVKELDDVKFTV